MTATPSIDLPRWMVERLSQASPDLLRNMIQTLAEALMSAAADAVCGAGYGQRSSERTNTRNGYRRRGWDTRAGSIDLAIPKLRGAGTSRSGCWSGAGGPSPHWSAWLPPPICSACRRDGWRSWSSPSASPGLWRSQVSEMAKDLDAQVEAF
jgi:putative transposase